MRPAALTARYRCILVQRKVCSALLQYLVYKRSTWRRCRSPKMTTWSRHSRRSEQPFRMPILPRRAWRSGPVTNAHGLIRGELGEEFVIGDTSGGCEAGSRRGFLFGSPRQSPLLDDLKERYGNRLRVSILDVTNAKEIVSVVEGAFDALGKIDFAVSNAGYIMVGTQKKRSCQGLSACLIPISWEASYSRKPLFLTCASRAVAESCKSRASRVRWPILA
jgi:hypothetical protein